MYTHLSPCTVFTRDRRFASSHLCDHAMVGRVARCKLWHDLVLQGVYRLDEIGVEVCEDDHDDNNDENAVADIKS